MDIEAYRDEDGAWSVERPDALPIGIAWGLLLAVPMWAGIWWWMS
jgi:hypothetical protein